MSKESEAVKRWREVTKQRMVDSLGGKCCICGYNKCMKSLDLHHIDPNEKEFGLSKIIGHPTSWKKIVKELRKCVCICKNCHGELHDGMIGLPDNVIKFDEKYATYYEDKRKELFDECPICGKEKKKCRVTCSSVCAGKRYKGKVDWEKIDLLELKKTMNNVAIGKMFGVTESAVRKRLKKIKSSL